MIKTITNIQEFWDKIINKISKGHSTNFFLQKEEILELYENNKITYMEFDNGIYIFIEKNDFYQLFFLIEKRTLPILLPKFEQPVILEDVILSSKEHIPSEKDWKSVGFLPYLIRQRMYIPAKNILTKERNITFATKDMFDEISLLMNTSFEPYSAALPTNEELLQDILNKKILVSIESQKLIGFLRFEDVKQNCMLCHIAITPEARGIGLGNELINDWFFIKKDVKKFLLWVRTDNTAALKLYEKNGFLLDGRITSIMIKNI